MKVTIKDLEGTVIAEHAGNDKKGLQKPPGTWPSVPAPHSGARGGAVAAAVAAAAGRGVSTTASIR